MRNMLATLSASLAFCIAAPIALAQPGGHAGMASDHMMATPDEFKWVDFPRCRPEQSWLSSKVRSTSRGQ